MNKQEFKAKANQTIDEISAKINELKADKESAQENIKKQLEENIRSLEVKESELKDRLKDLENASESQWEDAKKTFSTIREKYNKTLSEIESQLISTK